jgi:FKBP-type peptidyl-prolyl cis-trans isomerase FklB
MRLLAFGLLFSFCATTLMAQEKLQILDTNGKTTADPVGYFLGFQFGANLAQNGIAAGDVKQEEVIKGMLDALSGKDPAVSDEVIQGAMKAFEQKLQARAAEKAKSKMAEGQKFLDDNKKKEGIQVTSTGLQYKIMKSGDGASPKATSEVSVHYEGKLTNGKVFDSSIQRGQPASFPLNRVIPGWTEALQRMKVGDKWQLFIPSNLAYGEEGRAPVIGPNEVLVFEVELLEVKQ